MIKRFYRIKTSRLSVRKMKPCSADADFISSLWQNGDVMKFVGFPEGIKESPENIIRITKERIKKGTEHHLIIERKGKSIGEALIRYDKKDKFAETDVKLLPKYQGRGYGIEVKRVLLMWIFKNTDARGVKATPNVKNIASIMMQEGVGGKRIKRIRYEFPKNMSSFTIPVESYLYIVYRRNWEKQKNQNPP
ncbi:MAG: GNAT family N-acetyltransferase [bacterium]|nr:GNAT family N-acetyltransferase [bacterium]